MGLKIKQINEFTNEQGFKDNGTTFPIRTVTFRNDTQEILIEWMVTTSSGSQYPQTQKIPFDFSNPEFVGLLLSNSDALHDLAMDIPFLPTPEGLKSFADFDAETIDVGLG